MFRKIVIPSILSLLIAAPVGAAVVRPDLAASVAPKQALGVMVRLEQLRVRRGVRSGRITPAELAQLRTLAGNLRARIEALKSAQEPLTPEQRQAVRQDLGRLHTAITFALRNGNGGAAPQR